MCGIAGIIKKKNGKVNREEIQMMNDAMSHRGPDAEGIYIDDTVGFGHRRLSIVDLSEGGRQPMFSHDRKYVLVFNGEIYNYIELKEYLKKKGAKFVTETDTEVIMEAYRFWGVDCTKKFNGMWSFALYDTVKRVVFFSRDRFGVKPLYIYESEDEFIFASEIKCITAIRPEQKIVDETQMARYLAGYQEDMDEHTFYKNIQNFRPSYSMLYQLDTNTVEYQKYWEINVPEFQRKWIYDNPYQKFLELLQDSIRIRLRADVKVGASLSGGLDSSTIVGIVTKKFRTKIHTFSSIYKEKNCNEKEYIDCMNQCADTIPHYIYPDRSDNIVQDMQEMLYYHDGPCFSASPYSGYCVYKGVGKHVKVMLDGQGADELFGGYLFFYRAKLKEVLRQNGRIAKIRAVILIASIWKVYPDIARSLATELLRETPMDKKWRQIKKRMRRKKQTQQHTRLKYRKKFSEIDLQIETQGNDSISNELDKDLNLQLQYRLLPRILHDVDRNSMARSLEVRLPFLDYRLVEFSYTLSDEDKIRGSYTKYIMRKSCKKYLPTKICNRRNKMGFPAPFDKWLRDERFQGEIKKYLDAFKDRNIVDAHSLERCYQAHMADKENREEELFRFMMLEMWLQKEIDTEHKKWVYEAG